MLNRQVFRDILKQKGLGLEVGWIARRAYAYAALRTERFRRTGRAPAPLMAVCILTENCNLRCPMCDLPQRFARNPEQRDTATWRRVLDDLAALGTAGVGFTGGEVTLRRDIFELIAHARGLGMPVTLNTNALALADGRLADLVAAGPTNLNVSIDSGRDDVNDRLRGGRDVLARTLRRIERITGHRDEQGAGFRVTVVTVLSDLNVGDLEGLFAKVRAAGADRIGFMPLHDIGPGRCRVAQVAADTRRIAETLRALAEAHDLPIENSAPYLDDLHRVMSGAGAMPVTCNAGYTSIVIGPDLTVYRCWPFFEKGEAFRAFDPETTTLKAIWNDGMFRRERLASLACKECFWNCHAELSYLVRM